MSGMRVSGSNNEIKRAGGEDRVNGMRGGVEAGQSPFEVAYRRFMEGHIKRRVGERRGRLERGNLHAEKLFLQNVWWPLFGNFDHLHPEYEVYDWERKSMFLDFAYLPPDGSRIGVELEGFQAHVRDMDREKHDYYTRRSSFLNAMKWTMLYSTHDDLKDNPALCKLLLQIAIGSTTERPRLPSVEKDIVLLAWSLGRPIRPIDVREHFQMDFRTARKRLRNLAEKDIVLPIVTGKGVRSYELTQKALDYLK